MGILLISIFGIATIVYLVISYLCLKRTTDVRNISPRVFYVSVSIIALCGVLILLGFYFLLAYLP